ncbi:MAG: DUF5689 domain-containing protein [Rikenellaceae bacterium]
MMLMLCRVSRWIWMLIIACKPLPQSVIADDGDDASSGDYAAVEVSIAYLKSLYQGEYRRVNEAVYIVASITANDAFGEYSDRLVVQDDSGAIEIAVELEDDLFNFGIGALLSLYCTDLWLGGYGGTITLGDEPTSDDVVEPLSVDLFGRKILILTYDSEPLAPTSLQIAEITTTHISRYIHLSALSFLDSDTSFCKYDQELGRRVATSHPMVNAQGEQISLYVPSTVTYADEQLPQGQVNVYGILSSYGGTYSISLVERRIYEF